MYGILKHHRYAILGTIWCFGWMVFDIVNDQPLFTAAIMAFLGGFCVTTLYLNERDRRAAIRQRAETDAYLAAFNARIRAIYAKEDQP